MLESLSIRTFKSLADVTVDLGTVNVFIGANGSGKSNLLEALGVLSAAAAGRVDDQSLMARGVRPGVPALYKSAFPSRGERIPPHLFFGARSNGAKYEVSLHNPLREPAPAWRFKTELWEGDNIERVGRSPAMRNGGNPERGLAALKAVEAEEGSALDLLATLQDYVIYTPTTPVLRGIVPETQPREPVGLSGGGLPRSVLGLIHEGRKSPFVRSICRDALELVDWARDFGYKQATKMPLSPAAAASDAVVLFRDKFMRDRDNLLSGYDASEGALYVLLLAVIAGDPRSPALCAVDNADHGLNPRLARSLFECLCRWYLQAEESRQILFTTHNPLVLDGLRMQDDRVRLFSVARTTSGRTTVRRVCLDDRLLEKAEQGWTLSRLWVMGHLGGVPVYAVQEN